VGSKETSFLLGPDARLAREEAPRIAGKAFGIQAVIASTATNGVIVAQGGSSQGFALYVKAGRLALAVRVNGTITSIAGREPLPAGPVEVSARVGAAGELRLAVGGATVAEGRAPAPIPRMPLDGLQVGRDDGGAVGPYRAPFAFVGKIDEVLIRIGD
jgi:arylsulfatase